MELLRIVLRVVFLLMIQQQISARRRFSFGFGSRRYNYVRPLKIEDLFGTHRPSTIMEIRFPIESIRPDISSFSWLRQNSKSSTSVNSTINEFKELLNNTEALNLTSLTGDHPENRIQNVTSSTSNQLVKRIQNVTSSTSNQSVKRIQNLTLSTIDQSEKRTMFHGIILPDIKQEDNKINKEWEVTSYALKTITIILIFVAIFIVIRYR